MRAVSSKSVNLLLTEGGAASEKYTRNMQPNRKMQNRDISENVTVWLAYMHKCFAQRPATWPV